MDSADQGYEAHLEFLGRCVREIWNRPGDDLKHPRHTPKPVIELFLKTFLKGSHISDSIDELVDGLCAN
jgi:hypothetical protein